jgi:hypothetical protein
VVAKALDIYIRDMNIEAWNNDQADTQFQGKGSSHELIALLLTETILHSLYSLNQPVIVLYLYAKSAFDVILRELLVKNIFNINSSNSQSLLYINNRLESRETFLDWNGQLMGPIYDEQGLKQGGISSSDLYKIFGKEQLTLAQKSRLGVKLRKLIIFSIGLADDTALISNDIQNLFYLLQLTKIFCSKYQVELCAEKTKLQVFSNKKMAHSVAISKTTSAIEIGGERIPFSLLHLRQFSIFSMITRLPGNIVHQHATNIFSFSTISQKSWFHQNQKMVLAV